MENKESNEPQGLRVFLNEYVHLQTFQGLFYSGFCKEVTFMGKGEFGEDIFLISIIDKYGKFVSVSSKEIKKIEMMDKERIKGGMK